MSEMNVGATSGPSAVSSDASPMRGMADTLHLPPLQLARPSGPVATPLQTIDALRSVQGAFADALASGDPEVMMAAVASVLRRSQMDVAEGDARMAETARDVQMRAQMAAFAKAQEAQRTAGIWSTLARIGMYIAAAASAVVGAAGACFSGGVSAVGGIALTAALIASAATITTMALQDAHVFQGEPPRWLSIAIAVTALIGSVCSLGASSASAIVLVGGAVSATAQGMQIAADVGVEAGWWKEPPPEFRYVCAGVSLAGAATAAVGALAGGGTSAVARAGQDAARAGTRSVDSSMRATASAFRAGAHVAQGVGQLAEGVGGIGASVSHHDADNARIDAARARAAVRHLNDVMDDLIEAMRQVMQSFQRNVQRASDVGQGVAATRSLMLSNLRPA